MSNKEQATTNQLTRDDFEFVDDSGDRLALCLDYEKNKAWVEVVPSGRNGTRAKFWHGHGTRLPISGHVAHLPTVLGLANVELEHIVAGYDVEWDGNNHIGTLDADATAALERLESALHDHDDLSGGYVASSIQDWLAEVQDDVPLTREGVEATAAFLVEEAFDEHNTLIHGDIEQHLLSLIRGRELAGDMSEERGDNEVQS